MKTINITVDAAGICGLSDDSAGSCGEHNNLTFAITPNSVFFENCEFYKLNIDGRYSDVLTLTGTELTYVVPQGALCPPEISCQVVGFKTVNEKSVLICRTKTFKLKVEPSPGAYLSINTDVFEPLETAIAHCGNITAVAEEQIAELETMAEELSARADEVESAAQNVMISAENYSQAAEAAAEKAQLAEQNAATASEAAKTEADAAAQNAAAAAQSAADAAEAAATVPQRIAEATEALTSDVDALKTRVYVDTSGLWGGRVNKIFRELYLDFSVSTAEYTASNINKITIGRNIGGEWVINLGRTTDQTKFITFNESAERYDVITAENADGVRAYAVIDWSELPDGSSATFQGISLNSVDVIGAWPIIYSFINGAGSAGVFSAVNITQINGGNRIEITDAEGTKEFDVLNGADGEDGFSPFVEVFEYDDSHTLVITDKFQSQQFDVLNGKDGADGYTPIRGVDYFTEEDKSAMVAAVIDAIGCPVFGVVDESNNIVLTGTLPDNTYTVKYEMEDGSTVDIGDLTLDTTVYYSVTGNLTNCYSSNSEAEAVEGEGYSATITANEGYTISSLAVTMGGADITASAVSGNNINIASVTGDIVITAQAEEVVVEIINQIPISTDASGNPFNGDQGWKTGYRLSLSSGNESAADGYECTGFIPVKYGDVLYIKNVEITNNNSTNMTFYDEEKNPVINTVSTNYGTTLYSLFVTYGTNTNGVYSSIIDAQHGLGLSETFNGFIRIGSTSITADSIVTVNQEIV